MRIGLGLSFDGYAIPRMNLLVSQWQLARVFYEFFPG
jgi:hypothetical protein